MHTFKEAFLVNQVPRYGHRLRLKTRWRFARASLSSETSVEIGLTGEAAV